MVTLSPALRRILAVAILAAPLVALWGLVGEPVTTKFESYDQSIAQSQALLARYLRIGAARERLQRQLKEVRQTQASLGGFLEGASGELVAAQLQNKVKGLVEANEGRLKSIQILKEQEENNFRRVAIRVTMIDDTEADKLEDLGDGLDERLVEAVSKAVVRRLSEQVVREIAREVVPDLAERIIRERIRQLESDDS